MLTYDIAYSKHKYTIKVGYIDGKVLKDIDNVTFVEQLTADLFEKSIRMLLKDPIHIPGIIQSQGDGISLSIRSLKE